MTRVRVLVLVLVLLPVLLYVGIWNRYRLRDDPILSPGQGQQAIKFLRDTLEGQKTGPPPRAALAHPTWITLFLDGELLLRHRAVASELSLAL